MTDLELQSHRLPMLNSHVTSHENLETRLARVTGLARFLLSFFPKPRRSVATQTE